MNRPDSGNRNTGLIGVSPAIRWAAELIVTFAPASSSVLVTGPTGSGKEMVARALHSLSGRPGRLVSMNCAAVPRELVEADLFGRSKGAFTGATASDGLIASASQGTLFLDELSSMPLEAQAKLLRVLEDKEVRRVGESHGRQVDFRAIAAAQDRALRQGREGRLREDLLHRLSGVVIPLPSLRERPEDIVPLARHFAERCRAQLTACGARSLSKHQWPGNVRELKNVVERAAMLSPGRVDGRAVEAAMSLGFGPDRDSPARNGLDVKREEMIAQGRSVNWETARLMKATGFSRATLFRRLGELRISVRVERRQLSADASRSVA